MFWSTRPFVRALLFLLTGIFLGYFVPLNLSLFLYLVFFALLTICLGGSFYWSNKNGIRLQWLKGLIMGLLLTLTGVFLVDLHTYSNLTIDVNEDDEFIARVINEPFPTQQSQKMMLEVKPLKTVTEGVPVEVIAFFEKDEKSESLKYGDRLLFRVKLAHPRVPMNPGEFDYRKYLAINGINYSVYIPGNKWEYLGNSPPNIFKKLAGQLRQYLLAALQSNGLGGRDYAVAAAILLGYDNLMDAELEQDFVTAGAMHILCVSGLHVGVIYLVLNLVFGFLRKSRWQKFVKAILLLFFVWAYAMLTGLSPSVQRAALMISIFIIGNAMNRQRDSFNTLAASAFLLLISDPLLIFNVGFQLSYAAVLGILIFHRPLYLLLYFKNPLLDKFWSVTVLSVAAQLGTFPLAAHYFHFFPTYFWLTNLVIFPLSFLIISIGMIFISISWLPVIPKLVGLVLSGLLYILNQLVGFVRYLPFHGINDIYFPWLKVWLVYFFITILFVMFVKKNQRLLLPAFLILFALVAFETIHKYQVLSQKKIVVYSINKNSAYDFISGDKHLLLIDSTLYNNAKNIDYFLSNSRINWGLSRSYSSISAPNNNLIDLFFDGEFIMLNNYKIAIVDGTEKYHSGKSKKIGLDALFVKGRKLLELENLQDYFDVNNVVLDNSVPTWKRKKIEKDANRLGISTYNVSENGALVIDLTNLK